MSDIITAPIKFLGATVLSFNTSLGLGIGGESTLNVDLIEDCDNGDSFQPLSGQVQVGSPAYFSAGAFNFGGILTNWTATQSSSGKTYNVKISDPRQLLENFIVIVDSFLDGPVITTNYCNAYAHFESSVLAGNCDSFGNSQSSERGMYYFNIIQALISRNPTVTPPNPTNISYTVDWASFPTAPNYYRVPGPSITALQLLQDICDVLGREFYVYLDAGGIIRVGTIDLSTPPSSFSMIIDSFNGIATELSYGEELRNEKTRALIFGEKQHYLTYIDEFEYFFGEDLVGDSMVPVVPNGRDNSGFIIEKKIDQVNATLFKPLANNGPYRISELDIRSAMSSYDSWMLRVLDKACGGAGTLNKAITDNYGAATRELQDTLKQFMNDNTLDAVGKHKAIIDMINNPTKAGAKAGEHDITHDLRALHNFVADLGNTYYGKQWICKLKEKICVREGENFQEKIFSSVPTSEGGWVDGDVAIIGLSEPELSFFRSDDYRINGFALFNTDGNGQGGAGSSSGSLGTVKPNKPIT